MAPARAKIIPKKFLGQHFLIDRRIKDRILTACELSPEDVVLEIGPGQGELTLDLAGRVRHVYAVETDRHLSGELKKREGSVRNLTVFHDDFLRFDPEKLPVTKIVGNLPYNVASPIIEKILTGPHPARRLYFMVQLEFAERLAAGPGTKAYGSLSCFIRYYADVTILFQIKNTAFRPRPKVTSAFVRLVRRPPPIRVGNEVFLFRVIRTAFGQRRKMIINTLAPLAAKADLERALTHAGVRPVQRPEEVSLEQFGAISEVLGKTEPVKGRTT